MKHQVIKTFIDAETMVGYNKGSTYTSEDVERVTFLHGQGFIKINSQMAKEKNEENLDALKKRASALKIKGYTKMTPKEIENAVARAGLEAEQ